MRKIVYITSRFPYPLNKGDRLRAYFQLRELARSTEVHLIAINEGQPSDADLKKLREFCTSVHVFPLGLASRIAPLLLSPFRKLPLQVAYFYNSGVRKKIEELITSIAPDHIHCHLIRTTEFVNRIAGIPYSVDFMDAFGKGMEKRELIEKNVFKKLLFRYEKKRLYTYEQQVLNKADQLFIISTQDRSAIQGHTQKEITVLPNGVDFETFFPRNDAKKYDLVFMGNLAYPPNIEAVSYLGEEIMPLVTQAMPAVKLLIAGIDAGPRIKALKSANIDVIENFEDISDSIAMSKIMLAPMRISIGLQNKIIQAMAMRVPCIVSTQSNKAVNAPHNEAVIEADTPQEFAAAVVDLLNDPAKADRIAAAGYEFVKANYSWELQNERMLNAIFGKR